MKKKKVVPEESDAVSDDEEENDEDFEMSDGELDESSEPEEGSLVSSALASECSSDSRMALGRSNSHKLAMLDVIRYRINDSNDGKLWSWHPRCYLCNIAMGSSDSNMAYAISGKLRQLIHFDCRSKWKKMFPEKKDVEFVPYDVYWRRQEIESGGMAQL